MLLSEGAFLLDYNARDKWIAMSDMISRRLGYKTKAAQTLDEVVDSERD